MHIHIKDTQNNNENEIHIIKKKISILTLTMLNFLNGIILPTFLALSIISIRNFKMKT